MHFGGAGGGSTILTYLYNQFFNCTSNKTGTGKIVFEEGNATLGSNPFVSTGNANPDDDNFELSSAIPGFYTQMYQSPTGVNQNFGDAGALVREYSAGGGGGLIPVYISSGLLQR